VHVDALRNVLVVRNQAVSLRVRITHICTCIDVVSCKNLVDLHHELTRMSAPWKMLKIMSLLLLTKMLEHSNTCRGYISIKTSKS
jgi:hypothetical protein